MVAVAVLLSVLLLTTHIGAIKIADAANNPASSNQSAENLCAKINYSHVGESQNE